MYIEEISRPFFGDAFCVAYFALGFSLVTLTMVIQLTLQMDRFVKQIRKWIEIDTGDNEQTTNEKIEHSKREKENQESNTSSKIVDPGVPGVDDEKIFRSSRHRTSKYLPDYFPKAEERKTVKFSNGDCHNSRIEKPIQNSRSTEISGSNGDCDGQALCNNKELPGNEQVSDVSAID